MAKLKKEGSIVAHCPGCSGGRSTFEWKINGHEIGVITKLIEGDWSLFGTSLYNMDYRLYKCAGCGIGAWATVAYKESDKYPGSYNKLIAFHPESKQPLSLPSDVPEGIINEFREAEKCYSHNCNRAAAALFRSVLDKTLRVNGYKTKQENNLYKQIEAAAEEGVITQARRKKAQNDIRVLGNDVLHDEWHEIKSDSVEAARHYCQRILEDFYDDRHSVLCLLKDAQRLSDD